MTLILDTAPLVSLADASEPRRDAILDALRHEDGPLILPGPATAEIDYLLGSRFGQLSPLPLLCEPDADPGDRVFTDWRAVSFSRRFTVSCFASRFCQWERHEMSAIQVRRCQQVCV